MKKLSVIFIATLFLGFATNLAFAQDTDGDGILDGDDNCSVTANGPNQGTCP